LEFKREISFSFLFFLASNLALHESYKMEQPEARQEEVVAMQEDTKPTGASSAHPSPLRGQICIFTSFEDG
jgi:hypothetical protein